MNKGFTLIELLIVSVIMVMLAGFLVSNFSRQRNELAAAATGMVSDIREAQGLAISGAGFGGLLRCGYGIAFLDEGSYVLYAGPDASVTDCVVDDHVFTLGEDDVIREIALSGGLELVGTGDIFFEPPLPYTYLDGARGGPDLSVSVKASGARCPSTACRTVNITGSGRIYTTQ
ncbi:MAG TPA: prepilin-type N-terminal cleavage/methylation domain-containing protein [Candidatus Paceibacterota bacterium]|nr:prepilin-type N-terminal cleavage/methylation domain-containing protein [Candidatus Paceibacterota bacterium]